MPQPQHNLPDGIMDIETARRKGIIKRFSEDKTKDEKSESDG